MPFIVIGTGDDLILSIATVRTKGWNDDFRDNFATVIAQHDHTGAGRGRTISSAALTSDSINGAKILLVNDEYLRSRDNADTGNIDLIKANTSDKIAFGLDIANFNIIQNTYITGRNAADSSNINMLKVDANDKIASGADFANLALINNVYLQARNNADNGYINILKIKTDDSLDVQPAVALASTLSLAGNLTLSSERISVNKTFTLANNVSAQNVTGATLTETKGNTFKVIYGIKVDATTDLVEHGELLLSYDGADWNQARSFSDDDSLVVFSVASGQLKYTTPTYSGYVDATLTYQIIEL